MTMALPVKFAARIPGLMKKKQQAAVQYGPIGVDLGRNGLRLVQFVNNGSDLALHASMFVPFSVELHESSKHLRALIKKVFRKNGFVGREVIACVQPEDAKIMMLSYMHKPGKQDEELIVQRIAERVDDDISNYVIDYMMVRPEVRDGQERSVLVAMAQRKAVINYLEHLRKAGLDVKLLEIEPTAIRRLVSARHDHDHTANLVTVSMGNSKTYITVLSGRRLIYERDIGFGEQQLIALLCKELELDEREARSMFVHDEAAYTQGIDQGEHNASVTDALYSVLKPLFMELVEDINMALVYAASETRGTPVKHVYLTNLIATWHGIESFIGSLIDVPVSVLMPFEGYRNAQSVESVSDPRAAVVTGMALHGMTEAV
jgi:type IV pilus assembly protein PilM